jgi:ferrous-iron efflux pump FieF
MLVNAVVIARKGVGSLMDHELPDDKRAEIIAIAQKNPKVREVDDLRTRSSGLQIFIQMHLVLDGALTLAQAHGISSDVHKDVETAFPGADIIIHQDPAEAAHASQRTVST